MPIDFTTEYSKRSDDELLHLASARHSLTTEAATALDAELRRRNLADSDLAEYRRFVKRQEQQEARHNRRKTFGPFKYSLSWSDLLWPFAAIALISFTYLMLPSRYHMTPDWEYAGFIVMMTSVLIAIAIRGVFSRKFVFRISLVISSAMHLVAVHAWRERVPNFSRGDAKLAALLGFGIFFAVFGFVRLANACSKTKKFEVRPEATKSERDTELHKQKGWN